jgi:hypothetical protein
LALTENQFEPAVNLMCERLDPHVIYRIMIDLLKRLYVKTRWSTQDDVKKLEEELRGMGLLSKKKSKMTHYKKKEFGGKLDDTVPLESQLREGTSNYSENGGRSANRGVGGQKSSRSFIYSMQAPKDGNISMRHLSIKKKNTDRSMQKSQLNIAGINKAEGDVTLGDILDEDYDNFNIYFHASNDIKRYIENEFTVNSNKDLKEHYMHNTDFESHPVMELIMKIYAFIKTLGSNHKFGGYMKKKTEDLKKHYWMLPSVAALCSNEELAFFKRRAPEPTPEEITIFCFITDICQSVEIINNNGDTTFAYYPMLPKVYYLTQKSVNNFRAECRIEQSTTKLMDLMSYVEQFDIEMEINCTLHDKYNFISKILSGDAFAKYKKGLWLMGFFINLLVIAFYEIVNGELIIADQRIAVLVFVLSMVKLFLCFVIINLWFAFRYNAIRRIEKEKFIIKDPGIDPDTGINWLRINL